MSTSDSLNEFESNSALFHRQRVTGIPGVVPGPESDLRLPPVAPRSLWPHLLGIWAAIWGVSVWAALFYEVVIARM